MNRMTHRALAALLAASVVFAPGIALAGGGFSLEVEGFFILDFAVFVFLIWFFAKGPAGKFLMDRHARVKAEMAEATRLRDEAQAKLDEYKKLQAGLDAEVSAIREGFAADGERERERIQAETAEQTERLTRSAERHLAQETAKLKAQLREELVAQVLAEAEAKIRTKLTPAAQRQLASRYIKDLEGLEELGQFAA